MPQRRSLSLCDILAKIEEHGAVVANTRRPNTGQPRKHKFRLNLVVHPSRTNFPADHTRSRRRPPLGSHRRRIGRCAYSVGVGRDPDFEDSESAPDDRPADPSRIPTRVLVTPLVAPPAALTQKEPNKKPLSAEFNVASITPRPENRSCRLLERRRCQRRLPPNKFVPPPQRRRAGAHDRDSRMLRL